MTSNRRIVLAERPVEMFTESSFRVVESPVPEPGGGEAVVQVEYLSLDPTMRGWARDEPSYLPPVQLGEVMRGGAAGHVVASNNAAYRVGASVMGLLGWQEYAVVGGTTGMLANVLPDGIDLVDALSLYGSTGVTAYFGVTDIGQAQAGETLVVSGAAGGVGSIAGQIGKILGCRVVGIAGGKEKCRWVVDELGFDGCIDYKPGNIFRIVTKRLRMQGFIVIDFLPRFPEAALQLGVWAAEGKIHNRVHLVEGFLSAPTAINMLFTGENTGKLVVKV